jgi:hypothetical protein
MGNDEAAERKAKHKATPLHYLGWETGAGATIWARAVEDELARHEAARERFGANRGRENWERLHGSALMLVVAIDQVLVYERRVRRLTGDADLAQARKRFDAVGRHAGDLRDLIAHLDEYAVGEGQREKGKRKPPLSQPYLWTFLSWSDGGGTFLNLGTRS